MDVSLNILILPLLGGYFLVSNCHRTKHIAKRHSGYRIFFDAAIAGVVLAIVAFLLVRVISWLLPGFATWWANTMPFVYSGTSLVAFVLGVVLCPAANWYWPAQGEVTRAIQQDNDYLEALIEKAMTEDILVSLTTTRGKVYIGKPAGNYLPAGERNYLKLIPHKSGYREPTTQELRITTHYTSAYDVISEDNGEFEDVDKDDFELVIPVREIHTINLFIKEAYRLFQRE